MNWQYRIDISDSRKQYEKNQDVEALKNNMVVCLENANVGYGRDRRFLNMLASELNDIADIEEYDQWLDKLYDWGDYQKTCWIDTIGKEV